MPPPILGGTSSGEEDAKSVRQLPRTPIYPNGAFAPDIADPEDVPKSLARRLLAKLKDRRYHSDVSLVTDMTSAEVISAVGDLLDEGYAFDRSGRYLRLRARKVSEVLPSLAVLVDGLFPPEVRPRSQGELEEADDTEGHVDEVGISVDVSTAVGEVSEGLVLSDPPEHLTIPLEQLGSLASAILAKRGAGKTYLGMVLVEELLGVSPPLTVVVFDPTGVWWGLCATEAGAPSSYELLLLGGPRGHLPFQPSDGVKLAELVGERYSAGLPLRVVVDLSQMAPSEQHGVVADFCERLFTLPHFPIHIVFDEADEFAPQKLGGASGNQRRSLNFVERLVMRGRSRGVGVTLISLRPAVISKNVLSQIDALYLLRMMEPNDLKAVRSWLDNFESGVTPEQREQCLGHLPVLPVGTSYFLRGGESVMFRRFRVRRKKTFDTSRTPENGVEAPSAVLGRPRGDVLAAARKILAGRDGK